MESTAARAIAKIGAMEPSTAPSQLAAFARLTSQEHTSGTSAQGKTHLCKISHQQLRKVLYFLALSCKSLAL
ncbi:MAG: transposase [Leptolyngbyaceae cyanobacterium]